MAEELCNIGYPTEGREGVGAKCDHARQQDCRLCLLLGPASNWAMCCALI